VTRHPIRHAHPRDKVLRGGRWRGRREVSSVAGLARDHGEKEKKAVDRARRNKHHDHDTMATRARKHPHTQPRFPPHVQHTVRSRPNPLPHSYSPSSPARPLFASSSPPALALLSSVPHSAAPDNPVVTQHRHSSSSPLPDCRYRPCCSGVATAAVSPPANQLVTLGCGREKRDPEKGKEKEKQKKKKQILPSHINHQQHNKRSYKF
jgi:hypothetical protein